jgi:hypothetical protein
MTPDHPTLEAELRELRAVALDEAFLTRLEASAEGTWVELGPQERAFENFLRGTSPAKLEPSFLASLEAIVRDVPFITDEKIVPFPKAAAAPPTRHSRPMWGAAAAVALIGAATALMMPAGIGPFQIYQEPSEWKLHPRRLQPRLERNPRRGRGLEIQQSTAQRC